MLLASTCSVGLAFSRTASFVPVFFSIDDLVELPSVIWAKTSSATFRCEDRREERVQVFQSPRAGFARSDLVGLFLLHKSMRIRPTKRSQGLTA